MSCMKTEKRTLLPQAAIGVLGVCGTAGAASVPSAETGVSLYHHFFISGGPIVWFVLLPMSVAVVYLVIDLGLSIRHKRLLPADLASLMAAHVAQYGIVGLAERFSRRPALISRAVIRAFGRSQQFHSGAESVRQFAAESLQEIGQNLLRRAEWCQIIGSVAPMVGLFGTVYGMIQAFNLLGIAEGQPAYDQLAGAISVALVTTFWGLLVAIPALFFYSIFRSRIEAYVGEAAVETDVLLGQLFKIQYITEKKNNADSAKQTERIHEVLYMTEPPRS